MLYINGRFLTQKMTGVHRFAYNLCRALVRAGVECRIIMPCAPVVSCYDVNGLDIVKYGKCSGHLWEQVVLPFYMRKHKKNLLLNFTSLGPIAVSNKIITIHDLAFLENPKWYSRSYYLFYKFLTPICAKTSKVILTVSEFSKKEIVRLLGINESKIYVIYNAADVLDCGNSADIINSIPSDFILAVSSLDPRKNFIRLMEAFAKMPDHNLVVVGGANKVFSDVSLPEGIKNVTFLGRVSDTSLVYLYRHAKAFVYPSLFEGFGIPPIEAMTYGCPVIVSDLDVLHEVCADSALYVDPYSVEDMIERILYLYNNEEAREILIAKGMKNVERFNWDKSSEALIKVINKYENV